MGMFAGTQFDRPPHCPVCEKLESECQCPPPAEPRTAPAKQIARIGMDKRKGGRFVTTIRDLKDEGTHLADLLTKLKSNCGSGGTISEGVIELQGDQRERAGQFLKSLGYRVKG